MIKTGISKNVYLQLIVKNQNQLSGRKTCLIVERFGGTREDVGNAVLPIGIGFGKGLRDLGKGRSANTFFEVAVRQYVMGTWSTYDVCFNILLNTSIVRSSSKVDNNVLEGKERERTN